MVLCHPGMIFDGIPCERAEDEAFWTTMITACLISSEKVRAFLVCSWPLNARG